MTINLEPKETLDIFITATANTERENKQIINRISVDGTEIEPPMKHTLLGVGSDPNNPDDPENPDENKTYSILGTVWVDKNKDGKRDTNEELLSNIKVYLLESNTNKVIKTTTTNQTGVYNFLGINRGSYVVAFEYDNKKYDVTTYKADGVEENLNSDAISKAIRINDTLTRCAATDTMTLDSNKYNIDLGLIDNPKFDLELEKSVELVQVSNSKGVSSYKFNGTKLAKVEIPEKQMAGSVVAITYKFTITNTGAVSGYANKIVDYKARDLTFSSTLNPEWYQDTDGNICNTTLTGREIKPGETVELSLILTKTMTTENTGISNNSAEIAESSNDLGIDDIDSVPGNKNTSEDDYGKADVIITVKTGGILFYGGIVLAILAIFALGAYEINRRVLRKI